MVCFLNTVVKWHGLWRDSFRVNDDVIISHQCLDSTYNQSVRYLGTQGRFACFELNLYSTLALARSVRLPHVSETDISRPTAYLDINLGLGLVEGLNLSAILSELMSLTLLPTILEYPHSPLNKM